MFDECALPLGLYSCDGGTMTVRPFSITFVVLLSSLHAFAQQTQSPVACPATEQAVREVGHQLWSSYRSRDVSTYEKLVDDGLYLNRRWRGAQGEAGRSCRAQETRRQHPYRYR